MEIRNCEITGQSFSISREEGEAYAFFDLPLPTLSPQERCRRYLTFRNDQQFFWRRCSATGTKIHSIYPDEAPFPVVSLEYWKSPECDNLKHAVNYESSRLFIEQLQELWNKVPRPAQTLEQSLDSRVCRNVKDVASSFLLFNAAKVVSSFYSSFLFDSHSCCDCYFVFSSAECYECVHCFDCRRLRWAEFCSGCADSFFLSHCRNCRHCLFCTNLQGKEYHIFNRPVPKAEYEQTVRDWAFTARPKVESAKEQFDEFLAAHPLPHIITDNPHANTGNYLQRCKNAYDSFECVDAENVVHCHALIGAKDCLDGYGFGGGMAKCVQFVEVGDTAESLVNCIDCRDNVSQLTYCSNCERCSNLFGCVGLTDKEYCVFNKQYTREEYSQLREEIVIRLKARGTWGKFFPPAFSGFAYNQSSAGLFMPMSKIPAKLVGFRWSDHDEYIRPSQLLAGREQSPEETFAECPVRLEDVNTSNIRSDIFICEMSGRPFRLTKEELALYELLSVAPPARAFEQRLQERITRLAPHALGQRKSSGSGAKLKTSFPAHWRRPIVRYEEWQENLPD